ncbi:MAG: rhodanese-like domain-containing protein [Steroidobacteraceae bacterium]
MVESVTSVELSSNLGGGVHADSPVHLDGFFATERLESEEILARARRRAPATKPGFAGSVTPKEAWQLITAHSAVLVDVRTAEERQFVGRIEDSIHVPWLIGPSLQRNLKFVRELEAKVRRDKVVLLLCRAGNRSTAAAQALTEARFPNAFNVLEGFEGDLDQRLQRGNEGGWRYHGLPWIQD